MKCHTQIVLRSNVIIDRASCSSVTLWRSRQFCRSARNRNTKGQLVLLKRCLVICQVFPAPEIGTTRLSFSSSKDVWSCARIYQCMISWTPLYLMFIICFQCGCGQKAFPPREEIQHQQPAGEGRGQGRLPQRI